MPTSVSIYTNATRPSASGNSGLSIFNSDSKQYQISDGTNWIIYDFDSTTALTNRYTVDFDGAGDYMSISDQNIFSLGSGGTENAFSISTWFNADSIGTFLIVTKDASGAREWAFRTISSKLSFFAFGTGGGYIGRQYNSALSTGQWYHAVVTYDGSKASSGIKLYLNGSQVDNANYASGTYTAAVNASAGVRVGALQVNNSYSNGKIDEVSIFNSELTGSQVANIYKGEESGGSGGTNGKPGELSTFSPVGWWRMGDGAEAGSGTTIYDASTNSNNGTLSGDASILSLTSGESIYV
jgi:hypothetical protein